MARRYDPNVNADEFFKKFQLPRILYVYWRGSEEDKPDRTLVGSTLRRRPDCGLFAFREWNRKERQNRLAAIRGCVSAVDYICSRSERRDTVRRRHEHRPYSEHDQHQPADECPEVQKDPWWPICGYSGGGVAMETYEDTGYVPVYKPGCSRCSTNWRGLNSVDDPTPLKKILVFGKGLEGSEGLERQLACGEVEVFCHWCTQEMVMDDGSEVVEMVSRHLSDG